VDFDALSYTWMKDIPRIGTSSIPALMFPVRFPLFDSKDGRRRAITCNGEALRIQANLYDFLVRLRQKRRGRSIWIDAICIDQENHEEKIPQINMMERIYKCAKTVLVWLGECTTSHHAAQFMAQLGPQSKEVGDFFIEKDILKLLGKLPSPEKYAKDMFLGSTSSKSPKNILGNYRASVGLMDILNRGYFQRAWIVQEMALARDLCFFVSSTEIPLKHLLNAIVWKSNMDGVLGITTNKQRSGYLSVPDILRSRDDRLNGKPWRLEDYVSLFRDRMATNPRDKVYAILGLVDEAHRPKLGNDAYKIPVAKAYMDFTVFLAKQIGWERVLPFVGKVEQGCENLPSWAPDYSVSLRPKPFSFYGCTQFTAASSRSPDFELGEKGEESKTSWTLKLSGAHLDVIEQIGESYDMFNMFQLTKMRGHMLDLVTKVGRRYPLTKEMTIDAFFSTLTADIFTCSNFDANRLRTEFIDWLDEMFFTPEEVMKDQGLLPSMIKAGTSVIRKVGDLPDDSELDGTHLSLSAIIDAFVEEHDSYRYQIASAADRPRSHYRTKRWVRDSPQPVADDPQDSNDKPPENPVEPTKFTYLRRNKTRANPQQSPVPAPPSSSSGQNTEPTQDADDEEKSLFKTAFNIFYKDRRIFRTKQRKVLGMAPSTVKKGDIVMLVAGLDVPYVFRDAGDGSGRLVLVGTAYVHGAMRGEMVGADGVEFGEWRVV
jgi:Heterokaryon incompatibility protein (HET)